MTRGGGLLRCFAPALLVWALTLAVAPAATIIFSGNFFPDSAGDGIPDGAIVQLIASPTDDVFADPLPDSFTGGAASDDIILATAVMDSFGGLFNAGTASGQASVKYGIADLSAGDALLVRWWPRLTSVSTRPGHSMDYGQFRPAANTTVTLGSNHPYLLPANESDIINLEMNVTFEGSVGFPPDPPGGDIALADMRFEQTAPIPEPNAAAMLALAAGAGILLGSRRRKKIPSS